ALMFIPKPVSPVALRTFVAQALHRRVLSSDKIAQQRDHSSDARARSRREAAELVQRMRKNAVISRATFDEHLTAQLGWIAHYFGAETAGFACMLEDHLQIVDCFGADAFSGPKYINAHLPLCDEIVVTGSSLMVPDTDTHPTFRTDSFPLG